MARFRRKRIRRRRGGKRRARRGYKISRGGIMF